MDSPDSRTARRSRRPRGKLRRRLRGGLTLGIGLLSAGVLYTMLVPQPQVVTAQDTLLAQGRQLYNNTCISCHGENLQGVHNRGPSLIGVGEAAVHFQVSTGRMPLARQEAQALRKPPLPEFDPDTARGRKNLRALSAYVHAHGGGPEMPPQSGTALIGEDTARGGLLFRLNCASCHNFTGRGGALTAGKYAPILNPATPDQLYAAMLTGPQAMPTFGDRQLTPEEKEDIIAYVLSVRDQKNTPGGYNLGEIGPAAEGAVAWLVGVVALVAIALWLGART
ncbi:menaquinol-cytochrome c reductase cytochrome c1 subunit precursor [Halopolyspora algeriensis]|uniref:Cytochrome bc1 complex cytochrome c subunit n=1 Tax=Halopolyspora algeriensis TaxID=1500506 RepID=A0A368VW63_9ACTN|nr:c-type cytochrome [Halopolyspora algeriensis]RCW46089.1 menaquinol-cytochrome c reductase cytochrome c1 subunit precursor [Halopolyspora algeriensis]TQM55494.1 menaquinol-cytochrome c reductase cytochrome c1 subunit precursor [Halopolyspora algeriensis]